MIPSTFLLRKIIIFSFLFLLIFTSCTKDDPSIFDNKKDYRLKEFHLIQDGDPNIKVIYGYEDSLLSNAIFYQYSEGELKESIKFIYSYNESGEITKEYYGYDTENNSWLSQCGLRDIFNFRNDDLISCVSYSFGDEFWEKSSEMEFIYVSGKLNEVDYEYDMISDRNKIKRKIYSYQDNKINEIAYYLKDDLFSKNKYIYNSDFLNEVKVSISYGAGDNINESIFLDYTDDNLASIEHYKGASIFFSYDENGNLISYSSCRVDDETLELEERIRGEYIFEEGNSNFPFLYDIFGIDNIYEYENSIYPNYFPIIP
jgi:hypothetical protein